MLTIVLSTMVIYIRQEPSLLKVLIRLEGLGVLCLYLIFRVINAEGFFEAYFLVLFSILVIEGIIGLFGLVLLVKFRGRDRVITYRL